MLKLGRYQPQKIQSSHLKLQKHLPDMNRVRRLNNLARTKVSIAAGKWMVKSTEVGGFISTQNGNLRR